MTAVANRRIPTPRATGVTACQQPCFCDDCWHNTVDNLVDDRAALLRAALEDRLYEDGFERSLAEEIISAIPVTRRLDVLRAMLTWDHLTPRVMMVDCLLDETDERSYKAVEDMSAVLLAAIRDQRAEGTALRVLVTNEIDQRARTAMTLERIRLAS